MVEPRKHTGTVALWSTYQIYSALLRVWNNPLISKLLNRPVYVFMGTGSYLKSDSTSWTAVSGIFSTVQYHRLFVNSEDVSFTWPDDGQASILYFRNPWQDHKWLVALEHNLPDMATNALVRSSHQDDHRILHSILIDTERTTYPFLHPKAHRHCNSIHRWWFWLRCPRVRQLDMSICELARWFW